MILVAHRASPSHTFMYAMHTHGVRRHGHSFVVDDIYRPTSCPLARLFVGSVSQLLRWLHGLHVFGDAFGLPWHVLAPSKQCTIGRSLSLAWTHPRAVIQRAVTATSCSMNPHRSMTQYQTPAQILTCNSNILASVRVAAACVSRPSYLHAVTPPVTPEPTLRTCPVCW